MKIDWTGHDGIRIEAGNMAIYIDPYQIEKGGVPADILLISHEHFDHCSMEDIEKIKTDDTAVVCSSGCKVEGNVQTVKPGDAVTVKGIQIEVVDSYNTDKPMHPKSMGGVGYIIEVEGQRIYHAGDTDLIPEMADFDCDIALLPVSGKYVMNADEAAEAAKRINPKVAVPIHWGSGVVGTVEDAERFQSLLEGTDIRVEIKEKTAP
ncbi:MAG: MBL fold metallo-hydrolase [Proteobacteria bacterium]|nr:MBL fold metallo-hydrolase [Pseudomonadota bacterium]